MIFSQYLSRSPIGVMHPSAQIYIYIFLHWKTCAENDDLNSTTVLLILENILHLEHLKLT